MDSSLRRNVPLFTLYHSIVSLLSTPRPSLGGLADVLWRRVAWSASVLVFAETERLRGTAGWVQRLRGSSLLAKTCISTAKALHLFILWVLHTPKSSNSVYIQTGQIMVCVYDKKKDRHENLQIVEDGSVQQSPESNTSVHMCPQRGVPVNRRAPTQCTHRYARSHTCTAAHLFSLGDNSVFIKVNKHLQKQQWGI